MGAFRGHIQVSQHVARRRRWVGTKRSPITRFHSTDANIKGRPALELVDNFNDNSLDTNLWSGTNVSESSGQLNMVGAVSGAMNSVKRYSLSESSVSVQLVQWAGTGNAYVLYAGNAAVNAFVCWYLSGTTIRAYMYDGTFNQQGTTPTYSATTHKYFRIRESGGVVYWDYSADGINWTEHASLAISPLPFDDQAAMLSFSSNGQTSGTTTWDNFNVLPTPTYTKTHTTDAAALIARRRNLVPNGNFESDTLATVPSGWTAYGGGTKAVVNDFVSGGTKSFKVNSATAMDGGAWLRVDGLPLGSSVTLTAWVKTDGTVTNGSMVLNTGQNGLSGAQTQVTSVGANANGRYTVTLDNLDQTGVIIFLGQGSFGATSTGTIWYDDVILEITSPTVPNGNAEKYPAAQVATTTDNRFPDGTAGGSTTDPGYGGWIMGKVGSASAMLDSTTYHTNPASFKISTTAVSSYIETRLGGVNSYWGAFGVPIKPGYTYSYSFWMKTNYVSGDSNSGAYLDWILSDTTGAGVSQEISTTSVKTTTGWTQYTGSFTASKNASWVHPELRIYGHTGTGTLIMDAWFDEITLIQTSPLPMNYFDGNSTGAAWRGTTNNSQSYTNIFQIWKTHTTDAYKRIAFAKIHSTDANKRKVTTKTHTADANKRVTGAIKFHTTDANKKKAGLLKTHTTDALKRKIGTVLHTTDSNKRKAGVLKTHTTDASIKWPLLETLSDNFNDNSLDSVKWSANSSNGTVLEQNNRLELSIASGSSGFNYAQLNTATFYSYDFRGSFLRWKNITFPDNAQKKAYVFVTIGVSRAVLWSYTNGTLSAIYNTGSDTVLFSVAYSAASHQYLRIRESGGTIYWDTSGDGATWTNRATQIPTGTLNLDAVYAGFEIDPIGTTTTVGNFFIDDVNIVSATYTRAHTTDALKLKQTLKTHTTDANKRKATLKTHTTDANKRVTGILRTHTTDANKRKVTTKVHTTDANKRAALLKSHTTDALKRKQTTKTQTTDALKRKVFTVVHTTDSLKRKPTTKVHTTDGYLWKPRKTIHTGSYSMDSTSLLQTDTDAMVNAIVAAIPNVTHIAIGTFLDFDSTSVNDQFAKWASSVHAAGKKLYIRSAGFNDWQGSWGVPQYTSADFATNHRTKMVTWLGNNAASLQAGDIFEPVPDEPENNSMWNTTYTTIGSGAGKTAFNAFIAGAISDAKAKLIQLGKTGIEVGVIHTNPSAAKDVIDDTTALSIETLGTDNYPDNGAASLPAYGTAMATELATYATSNKPTVRKDITFGPSIYTQLTQQDQADATGYELAAIQNALGRQLGGITIWQGGNQANDPYARILDWNGSAWVPRASTKTINALFGTQLVTGAGFTRENTTDTLLRKAFTKVHTTDALKRKLTTKVHTTDALKRKITTRTHTTDALKRTLVIKVHSTDALLRKQIAKVHTTDANKRKLTTKIHSTDANKRLVTLKSHTTDANKRLVVIKSHTTDTLKRKQFTKTQTTDALKRTQNLKTHSTDALKRKIFTLSHSTDANKRKVTTKLHTTDANKRAVTSRTHTTDAAILFARRLNFITNPQFDNSIQDWNTDGGVIDNTYGTVINPNSFKFTTIGNYDNFHMNTVIPVKAGDVLTASIYVTTLSPHTPNGAGSNQTNAIIYCYWQTAGGETVWTGSTVNLATVRTGYRMVGTLSAPAGATAATFYVYQYGVGTAYYNAPMVERNSTATPYFDGDSINAGWRGITDYSTSYSLSNVYTVAHTTDAFTRIGASKVHTTDANKRRVTTKTHSTDANKRLVTTKTHSTDALKRVVTAKTHTTDTLKRKINTRTQTTDALKRKQSLVSHTTDANKRKVTTKLHTTDANKRKLTTISHTTDANKRKSFAVSHTTSANKRVAGLLRSHSTDALKRKANTLAHTTDALKRTVVTIPHTTDGFKRTGNSVLHSTDANKRAITTRSHTTSANLRKATIKFHTTDSNKRKLTTATHTTDALRRKVNTRTHTTDAAILKARRLNFLPNPSFEVDLAGWTTYGGTTGPTLTRDTSQFVTGVASMKIVTDGSGTGGFGYMQGGSINVTGLTIGQTYTVSMYVKGPVGKRVNVYVGNKLGGGDHRTEYTIGSTGWVRYSDTYVAGTTNSGIITGVEDASGSPQTYYVDSILWEPTPSSALTFAGSGNGYVSAPYTFPTDAYSVLFWYKADAIFGNAEGWLSQAGSLSIGRQGLNSVEVYAYLNASADFAGARRLRISQSGEFPATDGQWHSRAYVIYVNSSNHGAVDSYEDGVFLSTHTTNYTGDTSTPSGNLGIGSLGLTGGTTFNGSMDRVTIVNRKVSTSEITGFQNGIVPANPGALWSMDEGSGTAVSDSTAWNNDGAFVGSGTAPAWQTSGVIELPSSYFDGASTGAGWRGTANNSVSYTDVYQLTRTHTTDALKRTLNTKAHTTDANKRKVNVVQHATDANKRKVTTRTHTTDANKRKAFSAQHSTSANKRKLTVVVHSTDANKRKLLTVSHSTGALKRKAFTKTHTTDSFLRRRLTTVHTTDGNKRKATLASHTTDAFVRTGNQRLHSTDANKRKTLTVSHTTSANKRVSGLIRVHTTDALKRKTQVVSHTTDALKRKSFTKVHTTSANKRKAITVVHSTDALKRAAFVKTHSTDALKRKPVTKFHTTDANKRKSGVLRAHSTDALKRKATLVSHLTDALKRKASVLVHTTSANKRKALLVAHSADSNKRRGGITLHTTDTLKRKAFVASHSTDTLLRHSFVTSHLTDANLRKFRTVHHSTDLYVSTARGVYHSTSAFLYNYDGTKKILVNGVWHHAVVRVLVDGEWTIAKVYYLSGSGWQLSQL